MRKVLGWIVAGIFIGLGVMIFNTGIALLFTRVPRLREWLKGELAAQVEAARKAQMN